MIHNQASRPIISSMLSLLAWGLDAAAHQTVVSMSFEQELPKSVFTSIVVFYHLVREVTRLFVPDQNLLCLKCCQVGDTLVDVARYQLFIAAMELGVGFLNERDPELVRLDARSKNGLL